MPGVEVKIAERGEVLVRGCDVFQGYLKNEEATREVIDPDGWFHTGDAGFIDPRGHLVIIDRAKDVGALADGTPFAPQFIENKLKFSPYIREAVAFGNDRPFVTAMVAIDLGTVGNWAERRGLAYTSYMDVSQKAETRELIREEITKANQTLPEATKIRRFLLLTKDLEADDAEMTRTRKVRRLYVADKYAEVIGALYGGPATRSSSRRRSRTRTAARPPSSRASGSRTWKERPPVSDDFGFFLLLMSNGILIGLMYALIALGFVLVYKATDAVNFAQGEFVMIAGILVAAALDIWKAPLWVSIALGLATMIAFGFALERVMLRKLIGRPVIAVVMATIGLAAILRGIGPTTFGAGSRPLPLPIPDEPIVLGPLFIPPIQLVGGLVSLMFLAGFGWFFVKSRKGIAMRAVADNQQVAMAMGINVERYFGLAWAMTGMVSALGGIIWGNIIGVDVNLALVGFKVFPVVILGGLDSIPGAIIGGLIVGIVENIAAGYVDPYVGGGTKDFAPYVLMIIALMVRPYGIFGKKIIERI